MPSYEHLIGGPNAGWTDEPFDLGGDVSRESNLTYLSAARIINFVAAPSSNDQPCDRFVFTVTSVAPLIC